MRIIIPCIFLFFSTSCFASDVTTEITQLLKDQDEAWNRGDLEGFVRPYEDSGNLVFVSDCGNPQSERAERAV